MATRRLRRTTHRQRPANRADPNGTNVVEPALVRVIMHTNFTLFSAILNGVNTKGGPGAGFSPIPG